MLTKTVTGDASTAGKPADGTGEDGDLQFALVGVGSNADLDPADPSTDRAATTMRAEVGPVDSTAVAVELHERLLARVAGAETAAGFAAFLDDWRERAATLGGRVRVDRHDDPPPEGEAVALREDGAWWSRWGRERSR